MLGGFISAEECHCSEDRKEKTELPRGNKPEQLLSSLLFVIY